MTTKEYFDKLAELEHQVVLANAQGDKKLAEERWNAMVKFQEEQWPGLEGDKS